MATIGIMDSGVGGLTVLAELRRIMPAEKYIYFSDNAYCPYGRRSAAEVAQRADVISNQLIERGADIIVIACNTATAAAIAQLRKKYNVPFVGMEPAIKPAVQLTRSGVVGVLATAGTLASAKYAQVRARFQDDVKIVEAVGDGFVELVESGVFSGSHAEAVVRASLVPLLNEGADAIVLGCTHYPFLTPILERIAESVGASARFVNPAPAVAKRTLNLLKEHDISIASGDSVASGSVELLSSGDRAPLERSFAIIERLH